MYNIKVYGFFGLNFAFEPWVSPGF